MLAGGVIAMHACQWTARYLAPLVTTNILAFYCTYKLGVFGHFEIVIDQHVFPLPLVVLCMSSRD